MDEEMKETEGEKNPKVQEILERLRELPVRLDRDIAKAMARLIDYSFSPIHYDYNGLTVEEKKRLTFEQFDRLADFAQTQLGLKEPPTKEELALALLEQKRETDPLWVADITVQDLQSGYSGILGPLFLLIEKLWCGVNSKSSPGAGGESFMDRFQNVRCGTASAHNNRETGNGYIMIGFRFPFPPEMTTMRYGRDDPASNGLLGSFAPKEEEKQ